ncbi:hypothetical protein Trydic_g9862 [Trypoxylus dichotomus]
MGNHCDHPYEQTPGVPEPDTAMALNVTWFARNTTLYKDAGVEPLVLHPKNSQPILRSSGRPLEPLVSASQDYDTRISWRYPRPRSLVVGHRD